jgi:fructose-1,6-bisphosphatase/inositol monophosphatase family enzyme
MSFRHVQGRRSSTGRSARAGAMMAALVRHGETVASWMLDPLSGRLACAQRGAGAWFDGRKIMTTSVAAPTTALKGAVLRFLPEALAVHVAFAGLRFAELSSGTGCAGADYPAIVTGVRDFTLYWRTLPWDHAPGVLFVCEAGGAALRLDGSLTGPLSMPGRGCSSPGTSPPGTRHVPRLSRRSHEPEGQSCARVTVTDCEGSNCCCDSD